MIASDTKDFMQNDTNILRFVAIALIINSHLEGYYPISYLSTGGAMGNALFFVLSSFGLFLSERRNPKLFIEWYTQRIKRIYPTVWIVIILFTLPYKIYMNALDIKDTLLFLGNFFYPPFWFLQALMIFYIIIYPLIKKYDVRKIYLCFFILSSIYIYSYLKYLDLSKWCIEDDPFQYIFYLIVFIFGVFLAQRNDKIRYTGPHDWAIFFLSIFIIYGHKFLMLKDVAPSLQFIQHLFIFPFIYYFLKVVRSHSVQLSIRQFPKFKSIINYVSKLTLELYLVHLYVIIFIPKLNLPFPVNIIAVLIVTIILAVFVKYLADHTFLRSKSSKTIVL